VVSVDFEGGPSAEGGAAGGSGKGGDVDSVVGQLAHPRSVLFETELCDVGRVVVNQKTRELEAVSWEHLRPEWKVVTSDDRLGGIWDAVLQVAKGDVHVVSRTSDETTWIFVDAPPNGAMAYYLVESKAGGEAESRESIAAGCKVTHLFVDRPTLAEWELPEPKPLLLRGRDGFLLPSYLTPAHGSGLDTALESAIPREKESDAEAVAALRLDAGAAAVRPMVLLPHGGPWARDSFGYSPYCQWLASRGFHVLQVNFRGSTGFGKAFLHAGNREWG